MFQFRSPFSQTEGGGALVVAAAGAELMKTVFPASCSLFLVPSFPAAFLFFGLLNWSSVRADTKPFTPPSLMGFALGKEH